MQLPVPLYKTNNGNAYLGDAHVLMEAMPSESVDLVVTSPPFALQRQKEYGNEPQERYVDWLLSFTDEIKRVLKDGGSFVIDLGGAYCKGRPVRSLYNYRFLIRMCDENGWNLAEEFFWFNPSKLPSPIEWVNKRKIRAKDAVNTVWWLSKTDFPKANVSKVLVPYSERMKLLLKNGDKYYSPKKRPSGHDISARFREDKGGAIPPNLIQTPNSESNSQYLRFCKIVGVQAHPARFPARLPEFFIEFLTEPRDVVLDIFAGSNTTGAVAEELGRKWLAFELERKYLAASALRFLGEKADENEVTSLFKNLVTGNIIGVEVPQPPAQDFLFEETL
ncbi:MAG: site-specific DNA-methyltransferase [Actinobacteria bacterium]|nr:site-specific DNA-methyltransferase [Actinomycetota bacterium]MCG2794701.1 site-specific DNA-methyltransferase [Actinomycetes bacterium]